MTERRPSQRLIFEEDRLQRLIGVDQEWLTECRNSLKTGTTNFLLGDPAARLLQNDTAIPRSLVPGAPTAHTIAVAVASLTALLADEPFPAKQLPEILSEFDSCGLSSTTASGDLPWPSPADEPPNVTALITLIHGYNRLHRSTGFTALLARHLAGLEFKETRAVEVPVLFDKGDQGAVGYLRLQILETGPAGLHPDPRLMTFLTVDANFETAIRNAWHISSLKNTDACILWTLTDATTRAPIHHVTGASLGAAWAVALDELATHRIIKKFWRRKLDPNCAVTAQLDDKNLTGVTGYENKIKAAGDHNLRVVVAQDDANRLDNDAARAHVDILGAKNIKEAIQKTRNITNRLAVGAVAVLTASFVAAATTGVIYASQVTASETRAAATNLLNVASAMQSTDPRKAALYTLASEKLNSSVESQQAMIDIIAANQMISRTFQASNQAIRHLETTNETLFVSSADKSISAWNTLTGAKLWSFQNDNSKTDFTIRPDGDALAVIDDTHIKLYDTTGDLPVLRKTVALEDDMRGAELRYMPEPLSSLEWNLIVVTDTEIQTRDPSDGKLKQRTPLPKAGPNEPKISATTVGKWHWKGDGAGLYLAMSDNRVVEWILGRVVVTEIIPARQIEGRIHTVGEYDLEGTIIVGTDHGIVLASAVSHSVQALDFGGVSEALAIEPLADGADSGLMIQRSDGLVFVPGNWGTTRFRVTINRTGPSQLVAMASSGDAVFAGDVGGKITVFNPAPGTKSKKVLGPSSAVTFTPDGDLIRTNALAGAMRIHSLERIEVEAKSEIPGDLPLKREYSTLKMLNNGTMYVNNVSANEKYVAAAGQTNQGTGVVLVWDVESGDPVKRIDFPAGPEAISKFRDIVSQVAFVDNGKKLVAYNAGSRVLSAWSTADWHKIAELSNSGDNPSLDVRPDGQEILMLTGTYAQLVDVQTLEVRSAVDIGNSRGIWYGSDTNEFVSLDEPQTISIRTGIDLKVSREVHLLEPALEVVMAPQRKNLAVLQVNGSVNVLSMDSFTSVMPRLVNPWGGDIPYVVWNPEGTKMAALGRTTRSDSVSVPTKTSIWSFGPQILRDDICRIAGQDLSESEWIDAVGKGIPKPELCPALSNDQPQVKSPTDNGPVPGTIQYLDGRPD